MFVPLATVIGWHVCVGSRFVAPVVSPPAVAVAAVGFVELG